MEKKPFVTKEQLDEIVKRYPTPFHLYDEKGIRENAEAVKEAFAWNPGFREYFAVKATPNPFILNILKEYDCGCDCSSLTELMLADSQGFDGQHIMKVSYHDQHNIVAHFLKKRNILQVVHVEYVLQISDGFASCSVQPLAYQEDPVR